MAAEPVFHQQTPGGVERVAISFGHALSNLPELLKNSTENAASECAVEAQTPRGIVVNLARSESAQDATGLVIEFMGDPFITFTSWAALVGVGRSSNRKSNAAADEFPFPKG